MRIFLALLVFGQVAWANGLQFPMETFVLPNGLTVTLQEDHSQPLVAINTRFRVGSGDEEPGLSGFAHLFEHLMFMGTDRNPNFDTVMEGLGGENNAYTWRDVTVYHATGPSSSLPTLLWLDADRFQTLADSMTDDKLNKQRDVVLKERQQRTEDRPEGWADYFYSEMVYPKGHPYFRATIGTREDIENAKLSDVKKFFKKWYVPQNASLAVVGDFDPVATKKLIEDLFGNWLSKENATQLREAAVPKLGPGVGFETTDQVARTIMEWVFPVWEVGNDNMPALELGTDILGNGRSSLLYKHFVEKEKLFTDIACTLQPFKAASEFWVYGTLRDGVSKADVASAWQRFFGDSRNLSVSREDLDRVRSIRTSGVKMSLDDFAKRAELINEHIYFYGWPVDFERRIERYNELDYEVENTVKHVLGNGLSWPLQIVISPLPAKEKEVALPQTAPPAAEERVFEWPEQTMSTLANGIGLVHVEKEAGSSFTLNVIINKGQLDVGASHAGLSYLTLSLLDQGTKTRTKEQIEQELAMAGVSSSGWPETYRTCLSFNGLIEGFEKACEIVADVIQHPKLAEDDFKRIQEEFIAAQESAYQNISTQARLVAMQAYFGEGSPLSIQGEGTAETLAKLTVADVQSFWEQCFVPANMTLVVAGPVSAEKAKEVLERTFGGWTAAASQAETPTFVIPKYTQQKNVVCDRSESEQTMIYYCMPQCCRKDSDRVAKELLEIMLGGCFTSRLNANLREAHGYTYSANCSLRQTRGYGVLIAAASVEKESTKAALDEFNNEFARLATGDVTQEELDKAFSLYKQACKMKLAQSGSICSTATQLLLYGEEISQIQADLDAAKRLTLEEINRVANDFVHPERGVLVLVGDKAEIEKQLAAQ